MMRAPAAGLVLALAGPALALDPAGPAELPPADYAGQQYVDSKGCMFVRAGTAAATIWVPRVSREGSPACDNPPSGRRVPVAEEGAATAFVPGADVPGPATSTGAAADPVPGGYFVSVGSFGDDGSSDTAEAKLRALGYGVVRGRVRGGTQTEITVFVGPFQDANAASEARQALHGNGFPDAIVTEP